jgi:hypothetical protein
LEVARKLLQGALRREKDDEIRNELKKRIKLLKSTLPNKVITTD